MHSLPPFEVICDLGRLDFQRTSNLLKASYWGGDRTDHLNRRAFENSICVIALVEGKQVGFGRASGDRALFARISDIIVWPEHRGRGIGKAIVKALLDHPALATVSTWALATSDAHGLYEQFGFHGLESGREMRLQR
jgi:GNAT superfamily N-acetyltransferase